MALTDEIGAALEAQRLEIIKRQSQTERLEVLTSHAWLSLFFGVFIIVIGFGLTVFGFKRWYWRVQEPLDAILRKQRAASLEQPESGE
jgi:hypothetical protein